MLILQHTDRGFQFLQGEPKLYDTLQDVYDKCQRDMSQDLDYFQRKRGGIPYTERDVTLYIDGHKFGLGDVLSTEKEEAILKSKQVRLVIHFCNDVCCHLLTQAKKG